DFNISSINPSDIAAEDLDEIAAILNSSNVSAGAGFAPDFSYVKSFQNFTWNITIPYNLSAELLGIIACNGTVENNSCMNSSLGNGSWWNIPSCANCGNCSDDTFALNCPQAGWVTVYGADPMPVYGSGGEAGGLSVNKTVLNDGAIVLNDTVRYLINISNTGSTGLFNVSVIDNYDVDLNYTGASVAPSTLNYSMRTASWVNIANLTSGESYALYVNFTAVMSAQSVANSVNSSAVNASGSVFSAYDSEGISIQSGASTTLSSLALGWNLISLAVSVT
ncbi:MAG: hypothetical protein ABH834_00970, partial [Candidatus Altiarchaeota archaeon]